MYDRLRLEDIATLTSYQQWTRDCGLVFVEFTDLSKDLEIHHALVRASSPATRSRWFLGCPGVYHRPLCSSRGALFPWHCPQGGKTKVFTVCIVDMHVFLRALQRSWTYLPTPPGPPSRCKMDITLDIPALPFSLLIPSAAEP